MADKHFCVDLSTLKIIWVVGSIQNTPGSELRDHAYITIRNIRKLVNSTHTEGF